MSAWGKIQNPHAENVNFADIMSEEYAQRLHRAEQKALSEREKQEELLAVRAVAQAMRDETPGTSADNEAGDWPDYSALLQETAGVNLDEAPGTSAAQDWPDYATLLQETAAVNSDEIIARTLQAQYDHEYNDELRRIEQQRNGKSKVRVTLNRYLREGEAYDLDDEPEDAYAGEHDSRHDWDRFDTNEKILDAIPKCGFKVDKEGEMITKHDAQLCGVRNACRVMSFPPEFQTGDGAGFDMKLSNQVFNQLKTYSRRGLKKNKQQDRKVDLATTEMGMDARTRLLLYKLISKHVLEQINGIISTGKEAIILHANSDPTYDSDTTDERKAPSLLPKECAVKVYKTTLNEFKQRDRYIKDDYRFKDRFSKQNNHVVINMWAEKEMYNMLRMQNAGIKCPDVVMLKKHVLVMSFIGSNNIAAPKLKDAQLNAAELAGAYAECVDTMYKLYNEAKLVHADLSEYNILWHDGHCWFIDVAQAVEPKHPSALEFLMRDCTNIVTVSISKPN